MKALKNTSLLVASLFIGMLLTSCGDKDDSPEPVPVTKSSNKAILDVSFDQFTGEAIEIKEEKSRIIVYVPWQTSWNLKPTIRHNGISISPEASAVQDFSKPVDYTITAEDGSTKTYTLVVASAKAGLADVESQYVYGISFSDNAYYKLLSAKEGKANDGLLKLEISLGVTVDSRYPNRNTRYFSNTLVLVKIFNSFLYTYDWQEYNGAAEALLVIHKSASASDSYWRPKSGSVKITSYDVEKKVVSGEFTNIKYMRGSEFPYYLVSGSFLNVPLDSN